MLISPSLLVLEIYCINHVLPNLLGVWHLNFAMITETLTVRLHHLLQANYSQVLSIQLILQLAQRRDTFAAMSNMLHNHQPCQNAQKLMDTSMNSLFIFSCHCSRGDFVYHTEDEFSHL